MGEGEENKFKEYNDVLGHIEGDRCLLKVAERMRMGVLKLNVPHPSSTVCDRVSVSVGVAGIVPRGSLKKETLISMADKALYRAKREGRNRTEVFSSP